MEVLTNGVGTEDWLEVSKDWQIRAYVLGTPVNNLTEGLFSETGDEEQEQLFTKADFQRDLRKVSRRIEK